jgi:hypothetical protein
MFLLKNLGADLLKCRLFMKFFKDNKLFSCWYKIINNNLTAVYLNFYGSIIFYKNGFHHNDKNIAHISDI